MDVQPPIAITRSDLAELTWIGLEGDLDVAGAGLIGGDLVRVCDARAHVVLDTRGIRVIDLFGVRLILGLKRRTEEGGRRFSIVASPPLRRLAGLAEMTEVLDCEADPDTLLGFERPVAAPCADPSDLRRLVADECERQRALVLRMARLTVEAQAVLETVRATNRRGVERRSRR